ncbi:MAG: hypothetical protein SWH61_03215 [Thermodesulfobacteriota bacterium]|nr:hypothetical protein [Thermodesulfobacteriota bacterium]
MDVFAVVVASLGSGVVGAATGAFAASRGKLGKSDHAKYCPENRDVLTKTEHDDRCDLKLEPIRTKMNENHELTKAIARKLQVPVE